MVNETSNKLEATTKFMKEKDAKKIKEMKRKVERGNK